MSEKNFETVIAEAIEDSNCKGKKMTSNNAEILVAVITAELDEREITENNISQYMRECIEFCNCNGTLKTSNNAELLITKLSEKLDDAEITSGLKQYMQERIEALNCNGKLTTSDNAELLSLELAKKLDRIERNIFPFPYYDGESKTDNGITFTVQEDKSIIANGTATDNAEFSLQAWAEISLNKGKYKISGCPQGGSADGYCVNFALKSGEEYPLDALEYGEGLSVELENGAEAIYGNIMIASDTTLDNVVFKPKLVKVG